MSNITSSELKELERYLDQVWNTLGIDVNFTKHFLDRVNDPRNGKPIEFMELRKLFVDTYKKYGSMFSRMGKKDQEIEGVLTDLSTKINSPFVLKWDGKTREFDLVAKTIMRKSGFRPNNSKEKQYKVESIQIFESRSYIKNHPAVQSFDDNPGEYFVNLKPGWSWSGQRSFGGETIGEIAKLLRQVEKTGIRESRILINNRDIPGKPTHGLMENLKTIIRKNKR